MLFDVKIVSRSEYEAHMQKLRDAGQTGRLDSGRSVDAAGVTS
jgi:hypothetical protein